MGHNRITCTVLENLQVHAGHCECALPVFLLCKLFATAYRTLLHLECLQATVTSVEKKKSHLSMLLCVHVDAYNLWKSGVQLCRILSAFFERLEAVLL